MKVSQSEILSLPSGPHRLTRQRKLILTILEEYPDHLDADKLYQVARQRGAEISLATIYRTLAFLREAGLIEEHLFGEDHRHFEPTHDSPHNHFTCQGCGNVIEFQTVDVTQAIEHICRQEGLQISTISLHLSGYCPACQSEKLLQDPLADYSETRLST